MATNGLMNEEQYEEAVTKAAERLEKAETADDVRRVWTDYVGEVGHKNLGRLLLRRVTPEALAERAGERIQMARGGKEKEKEEEDE